MTARPMALGAAIQFEHDGQAATVTMTLVRTHWDDEGHVITELIVADGSHWATYGTFEVRRSNEGPAALKIESDMPLPLVDTADDKAVADRLMAELVRVGGGWGIESFEACS